MNLILPALVLSVAFLPGSHSIQSPLQSFPTITMTQERRRSIFRPCIDLHDGVVKQIVGATLSDSKPGTLKTNFVAM